MQEMSGSCWATTSHIWNPGLQLVLVILTVLQTQRDLSLWQDQSWTEKIQDTQTCSHFFSRKPMPTPNNPRCPGPCHTGSQGKVESESLSQ